MLKSRSIALFLAALLLGVGVWTSFSSAQDGGGGGRGSDEDRAAQMAEWRQRMNDRMKESLGASDDEWKVLQPRIEKVQNLQMQRYSGMGRGMGFGRGGRGSGDGAAGGGNNAGGGARGDRPQSEVGKAQEELRKVLEDKSSSAEVVKSKLEALRAAREKSRTDLVKAQAELKEIVSVRQEAQLVSMGTLE